MTIDRHPAPLDPNFAGAGRCLTDAEGRYRFVTVKPGAYPWGNHPNAWRPAHIHFSLFGRLFAERLVTQMYFPGDPLFEFDPIFNSVRDPRARDLLVAKLDLDVTEEAGRSATRGTSWSVGAGRGRHRPTSIDSSGHTLPDRRALLRHRAVPPSRPRARRSRRSGGNPCAGTVYDGAGDAIGDAVIEAWDATSRRWGRSGTTADGAFELVVGRPEGRPPDAPRLDVYVFARGLLRHQLTRMYFPDEAAANGRDPVLASLPEADRATLVASEEEGGLRFDVRMQGERATVFFAL